MDRKDSGFFIVLVLVATVFMVGITIESCTVVTPTAEPPTVTPPTSTIITPTPNTSPIATPGITATLTVTQTADASDSRVLEQRAEVEKIQMEETEKMGNLGIDYGSASVAGVSVVLLVLLVVEGAKQFGVTGKASLGLSVGLGAILLALYAAIERQLIPTAALPWIEVVFYAVGGGLTVGLAPSGLYNLLKRMNVLKG